MRLGLLQKTLIFLLLFVSSAALADVRVIAHPDLGEINLPPQQLRLLFSSQIPYWPDGTPVTLVVMDKEHEWHRRFCQEVLSLFPYQLERVWRRRIYSGIGRAPIRVSSREEMVNTVGRTKGAIGYVQMEEIPSQVVLVSVD
ncbi:hypothetical protein [Gallaecimonas sp. GXIMD4217]|uniref:hypothetical protein n=1 Tax=Gallaecimonas sp. GXIMD4217 TaxID=3131927 RepID=UPI00311AF72C